MKLSKYIFPVSTLSVLVEIDKLKSDLFYKTYDERGNLIFRYHDNGSDFYFRINLSAPKPGDTSLLLQWKPSNINNVNDAAIKVEVGNIISQIRAWEELLKLYDGLYFEEDAILKQYQEEYFNEFEIIDDGNNEKPLNDSQVYFLESHLKNIIDHIDDYQNDYNENLIESIRHESTTLLLQLTSINKGEVVKKIVSIWSKMKKAGIDVVKDLLAEIKKEAISTIAKAAVEQLPHIVEKLLKH